MPFSNISDPAKLQRLLEAVLLLEADFSLPVLLQHFVEEARSMTGARYGALGVLNDEGTILSDFVTVGIEEQTEQMIGPRPTGQGVLGVLIAEPRPLRLRNLNEHSESLGFPPHHPSMTSFLGVPVKTHDEVYGHLYLTDKTDGAEFTQDDEDMATGLASVVGIAIENARLHARVSEVAVLDDRDRIAHDLHDAVIQRLFAVGLSLQSITRSVTSSSIQERLSRAVADIDDTIRQIRSSIFELSSPSDLRGARAHILSLVRELDPVIGLEAHVSFEGPIDSSLTADVLEHLLLTLREALTNVGRHAQANSVHVRTVVRDRWCALTVSDNGQGFSAEMVQRGGFGLPNMRRRAEKLGGHVAIKSSPSGTTIEWRVPIDPQGTPSSS